MMSDAMSESEEFWAVLKAEAREREQSRKAAQRRAETHIKSEYGDAREVTQEHAAIACLANDGLWLLQLAEGVYQLLMYGPDREAAQERAVELMGEFDRQSAEWYENGYRVACTLALAPMLPGEGIREGGRG